MSLWQDAFLDWVPAWAAVQDQESEVAGSVVMVGARPAMVWPADDGANVDGLADTVAQAPELVLVTEDPDGATRLAESLGLRAATRLVLLCAETDNLDLVPHLPQDANLVEAPMGNYDLVEVALFDRPVARGRLGLGEGLGVLAALDVDPGHEDLLPAFEQAVVAGLGEEAFTHGADVLFLVAGQEQAARFAAVDGWSQVAQILSFTR